MTTTTRPPVCPSWCNDHDGFDDGSADWHKSRNVTVAGSEMFLSTGNDTGLPEVFVLDHAQELTLEDARKLALLGLVSTAETVEERA